MGLPNRDSRRWVANDETGKVYGKLTVLHRASNKITKNGKRELGAVWVCKCECGTTAIIRASSLRTGNTTSCGCTRVESFKRAITKPEGVAATNKAIGIMLGNARRRGLDWELSMEAPRLDRKPV